jgi:hypothetical protein
VRPYGRPADIWGVGVLIYELLTGRPPFQHRCPELMALLVQAGAQEPLPPGRSPECAAFVDAAMCLNPAERPTAAKLLTHPWVLRSGAGAGAAAAGSAAAAGVRSGSSAGSSFSGRVSSGLTSEAGAWHLQLQYQQLQQLQQLQQQALSAAAQQLHNQHLQSQHWHPRQQQAQQQQQPLEPNPLQASQDEAARVVYLNSVAPLKERGTTTTSSRDDSTPGVPDSAYSEAAAAYTAAAAAGSCRSSGDAGAARARGSFEGSGTQTPTALTLPPVVGLLPLGAAGVGPGVGAGGLQMTAERTQSSAARLVGATAAAMAAAGMETVEEGSAEGTMLRLSPMQLPSTSQPLPRVPLAVAHLLASRPAAAPAAPRPPAQGPARAGGLKQRRPSLLLFAMQPLPPAAPSAASAGDARAVAMDMQRAFGKGGHLHYELQHTALKRRVRPDRECISGALRKLSDSDNLSTANAVYGSMQLSQVADSATTGLSTAGVASLLRGGSAAERSGSGSGAARSPPAGGSAGGSLRGSACRSGSGSGGAVPGIVVAIALPPEPRPPPDVSGSPFGSLIMLEHLSDMGFAMSESGASPVNSGSVLSASHVGSWQFQGSDPGGGRAGGNSLVRDLSGKQRAPPHRGGGGMHSPPQLPPQPLVMRRQPQGRQEDGPSTPLRKSGEYRASSLGGAGQGAKDQRQEREQQAQQQQQQEPPPQQQPTGAPLAAGGEEGPGAAAAAPAPAPKPPARRTALRQLLFCFSRPVAVVV